MTVSFPIYPVSKWLCRKAHSDIFIETDSICNLKMIWAHFASVATYPTRLRLRGYLNITEIQIIYTCTCFKYLQGDWTGVMLLDNMKLVMNLPSKGKISVWTDDDLKCIDARELYQMQILYRVLAHIMDLKQHTEGDTGQQLMTASVPAIMNTTKDEP